MCESCMMPFSKDHWKRESEKYCSYCFQNGKLTYEWDDLKEFQALCYAGMKESGMNPIMAKIYTWMVRFAPRWKK